MKKEYDLTHMQSRKNPYAHTLAGGDAQGNEQRAAWPKQYSPEDAPSEVLKLTDQLVPQLLAGDHPALALLNEQYKAARVESVELTGHGFYVNFEVPADALRVTPADFAGGSASIELAGASVSAGCVLFVRGGRLAFFEGYTYDGEWPEHATVTAVKDVVPLTLPEAAE